MRWIYGRHRAKFKARCEEQKHPEALWQESLDCCVQSKRAFKRWGRLAEHLVKAGDGYRTWATLSMYKGPPVSRDSIERPAQEQ